MKEIMPVTLVKYGHFCLYMLNVRYMLNLYDSVIYYDTFTVLSRASNVIIHIRPDCEGEYQ